MERVPADGRYAASQSPLRLIDCASPSGALMPCFSVSHLSMSHRSGTLFRPKPVLAAALLAAAVSLAACSGQPQSIADYIAAICATPFRSATPDEAPFLSANVGAMTKMMV